MKLMKDVTDFLIDMKRNEGEIVGFRDIFGKTHCILCSLVKGRINTNIDTLEKDIITFENKENSRCDICGSELIFSLEETGHLYQDIQNLLDSIYDQVQDKSPIEQDRIINSLKQFAHNGEMHDYAKMILAEGIDGIMKQIKEERGA